MTLINDFVVLPPVSIDATKMLFGPPDAENQVFDVGDRPYALNHEVWDAGNSYRSLVDNNNADLTDPASWEDLGPVDEGALKWVAGTYAVDVYKVHNSILWQSAKASNSTEPSDDNNDWTNRGPTNRFKAWATFPEDVTTNKNRLRYLIQAGERITDMVFLRPVGSSVIVKVWESDGVTLLAEETLRTTRDSGGRWFNYFNSKVETVGSVTLRGLPTQSSAIIEILIENISGSDASVSQIIAGFGEANAAVIPGTGTGMLSFSEKSFNGFGRPVIKGFTPQKKVTFALEMPVLAVDRFSESLFKLEAIPAAFFMEEGGPYGAVVYGIFEDFYVDHNNVALAKCNLTILGFNR